jgi:hypothetical protein
VQQPPADGIIDPTSGSIHQLHIPLLLLPTAMSANATLTLLFLPTLISFFASGQHKGLLLEAPMAA